MMTRTPKANTAAPLTDEALDAAAGGYELENVFVTSYQTGGSGHSAGDRPTEEVAFYYNRIR